MPASIAGLVSTFPMLLLLLPLVVLIELLAEFLLNWDENWTPPQEKDSVLKRGSDYQSRALTVLGLVVAAIAILVSTGGGLPKNKVSILALGLSAGLLLLSHQSENLILYRTAMERLQVKTFEFGAFSLFIGLILIFHHYSIPFIEILEIPLLLALFIHYAAWTIYLTGLYKRKR